MHRLSLNLQLLLSLWLVCVITDLISQETRVKQGKHRYKEAIYKGMSSIPPLVVNSMIIT
jgi:hypothetical protein